MNSAPGLVFDFYIDQRKSTLKYKKSPVTVAAQVQKLKDRGLKFENESEAQRFLLNISYYRLRAYTYPFQDNGDKHHPFIVDISFQQIIDLYIFDQRLRALIFEGLEKIEIALRAQIIYQFSLRHGSHWQLIPDLYRDQIRFSQHLKKLQKQVDRSDEDFISHYKSKYTYPVEPPSWMSLEVSSMGLMSQIFQNLKKGIEKNEVTLHFGVREVAILENWLHAFSALRNICAHHGRVWNRRLMPVKLPTHPIQTFLQNKSIFPNKLYATLSCMAYVLKIINQGNSFNERVAALMKICPMAQEKEMGFPTN